MARGAPEGSARAEWPRAGAGRRAATGGTVSAITTAAVAAGSRDRKAACGAARREQRPCERPRPVYGEIWDLLRAERPVEPLDGLDHRAREVEPGAAQRGPADRLPHEQRLGTA